MYRYTYVCVFQAIVTKPKHNTLKRERVEVEEKSEIMGKFIRKTGAVDSGWPLAPESSELLVQAGEGQCCWTLGVAAHPVTARPWEYKQTEFFLVLHKNRKSQVALLCFQLGSPTAGVKGVLKTWQATPWQLQQHGKGLEGALQPFWAPWRVSLGGWAKESPVVSLGAEAKSPSKTANQAG